MVTIFVVVDASEDQATIEPRLEKPRSSLQRVVYPTCVGHLCLCFKGLGYSRQPTLFELSKAVVMSN